MSALKIVLYIFAGLLLIAGAACIGIFYHNGSIEAIGAAMMFLCFGVAGFVLAIFSDQIMQTMRAHRGRSA